MRRYASGEAASVAEAAVPQGDASDLSELSAMSEDADALSEMDDDEPAGKMEL